MTVYKPSQDIIHSQQSAKPTPSYIIIITTNPEARETLTCLAGSIKKVET